MSILISSRLTLAWALALTPLSQISLLCLSQFVRILQGECHVNRGDLPTWGLERLFSTNHCRRPLHGDDAEPQKVIGSEEKAGAGSPRSWPGHANQTQSASPNIIRVQTVRARFSIGLDTTISSTLCNCSHLLSVPGSLVWLAIASLWRQSQPAVAKLTGQRTPDTHLPLRPPSALPNERPATAVHPIIAAIGVHQVTER